MCPCKGYNELIKTLGATGAAAAWRWSETIEDRCWRAADNGGIARRRDCAESIRLRMEIIGLEYVIMSWRVLL